MLSSDMLAQSIHQDRLQSIEIHLADINPEMQVAYLRNAHALRSRAILKFIDRVSGWLTAGSKNAQTD
jgi:hypothetical protein